MCPFTVLSLGPGQNYGGTPGNPISGCSWSGHPEETDSAAEASLQAAQERDEDHCTGCCCELAPLSSCKVPFSTLVLKGLSCLLQPNSAGYLPVGFIVNMDQIREGVVRGRDGSWFRDPSSPHPAVFGFRLALPLILVSAPNNLPAGLLGESHSMVLWHTYTTRKAEAVVVGTNRGGRLCSAASES